MIVSELIEKLQEFDRDLEVSITDGWECRCYTTNHLGIELFEEDNGKFLVDIGIGDDLI